MAKLPNLRSLKVEDFPNQKDWIGKLINVLNDFFTSTYTALNGGLTFSENINSYKMDIVFKGGEKLTLKNELTSVPSGIIVIKLQLNSNQLTDITSTYSPYWYYDYNNKYIKLLINGLTAGDEYRATILVIGG